MKCALIMFLVGLLALPASATNQRQKTNPGAAADAHSTAGAVAGSLATGGAGGASGTGGSASSNNSVSVTGAPGAYGYDSDFYVLPAPMFAPQLPAIESPCTNSSQHGFSFGWSLASGYEASSNTDNCVAIAMYNAAVKSCRYATAGQIMDRLTVKVLAGFEPAKQADLIDLTQKECRDLREPVRKPPLVAAFEPDVLIATAKKADKPVEPASAPKKPKKAAPPVTASACMRAATASCNVKQ